MEREQIKYNGIRLMAVWYNRLLIVLLAFLPLSLILYIDYQTSNDETFIAYDFHVIAIVSSTLFSAFLSYITWRCYRATGEELLRWLVYGFLGFTFIYAPHGFLTHYSIENIWVFTLYGPASRLVLAFCFLVAMLNYGKTVKPETIKSKKLYFAIAIFIAINVLVFWVAHLTSVNLNWWRLIAEYLSISIFTGSVLWMLVQNIRGYMSVLYAVAMIWFALSCLSFSVASVWEHQWWLAHIVFSGGFLILSYGVVQAFLTTGSFKTIYSQNELFQQIIHEKKKSEQALIELQKVNQQLEELAATDSLTGVANRREFTRRSEEEVSRSYRNRTDLCVMVIDFDHFKEINDQYGHQAGDKVLKEFVKLTKEIMRPSDLLGRLGGEEFALLLPETNLRSALKVAERLRQYIEGNPVAIGKEKIELTISIGVADYQPKVDTVKKWLHRADEMLYQAKDRGRNRVEADSSEQKGEEHGL